ncbi:DUF6345 domain-containing protein [Streptosporangium saharense]|uniref:DUF6345 domain-containing protein n=1 Tax=Streptosporangium saharense TaxID=1706840 RepID=UPI00367C7656
MITPARSPREPAPIPEHHPIPVSKHPESLFENNVTGDFLGLYSITNYDEYCADPLFDTHRDAAGFQKALSKPASFHLKDEKVHSRYYHGDGAGSSYGIDTNVVTYHSGHGDLSDPKGRYTPFLHHKGDCWAWSDRMVIGAKNCRYIFWSTCYSLRIGKDEKTGRQNTPPRTWGAANHGFRMIFGYQTYSNDHFRYGEKFVRYVRGGYSFSEAFLLASWVINPYQTPVAAACGSIGTETRNRLLNERKFSKARVRPTHWRWVALERHSEVRERNLQPPPIPLVGVLDPETTPSPAELALRFGLDPADLYRYGEHTTVADDRRRLSIGQDGDWILHLADLGDSAGRGGSCSDDRAQALAWAFLAEHDLDGEPLVLDQIAHITIDGADDADDADSKGADDPPAPLATLVQFRQVVNGLPVITPDAGALKVIIGQDETVVSVASSLRFLTRLSGSPVSGPPPAQLPDAEEALGRELGELLRAFALEGVVPAVTVVPDTTEVGYDIEDDHAVLAAYRLVKLDFPQGLTKSYWLRAVLFG